MDVVAFAGAVSRVVVVAVDRQALQLADRDLCDVRHQVVGDAGRVLADQAALVRADRVEVTQQRDAPGRVRGRDVGQHALDHGLRRAVRIGGADRKVLADRQRVRIAVDGGRRTEHQPLDVGPRHRVDQRQRAGHVVVVVHQRLCDRLADRLQAREVDHRDDRVRREDTFERGRVAHVGLDEDRRGPRDALDAPDRFALAVDEVVDDDRHEAGGQQFDAGVRADVAGAAGDEDVRGHARAVPMEQRVGGAVDANRSPRGRCRSHDRGTPRRRDGCSTPWGT